MFLAYVYVQLMKLLKLSYGEKFEKFENFKVLKVLVHPTILTDDEYSVFYKHFLRFIPSVASLI